MSKLRLVLGATCIVALMSGATTLINGTAENVSRSGGAAEGSVWVQIQEVGRIQAHLLGAEQLLLARDVSHLTPAQRAARGRHIRALSEYRERGLFPRNEHFPGRRVPYFVDSRGTHCAMAHLIAASGREDIVRRVARTRNNAYMRELADDSRIVAWLDSAGLTLDEAARIQPKYAPSPPPETASRTSSNYAIRSTVVTALSGAAIALNAGSDPPRWQKAFGLVAGAVGIGIGFRRLDEDGGTRALRRSTLLSEQRPSVWPRTVREGPEAGSTVDEARSELQIDCPHSRHHPGRSCVIGEGGCELLT